LLSQLTAPHARGRYEYWPFGDPFIHKRKRDAQKRRRAGQRPWYDDEY
jgi:hypothetical protein